MNMLNPQIKGNKPIWSIVATKPVIQVITQETVRRYTVVKDDNLTILSKRFGVSIEQIAEKNKLKSIHLIKVGQELIID